MPDQDPTTPPEPTPQDQAPPPEPEAGAPQPQSAEAQESDAIAAEALEKAKAAVADLSEETAKAARSGEADTGPRPLDVPDLTETSIGALPDGLSLLSDVNLNVKIELGRTRMLVEDVLRLGEGAVVELDKLAGDPVDIFVNDRPVARGEVLVLNDNFCVRINEILAPVRVTSAPAAGKAPAA